MSRVVVAGIIAAVACAAEPIRLAPPRVEQPPDAERAEPDGGGGRDADAPDAPPAATPPEIFSYGLGAPAADCSVDRMIARLGDCRRVPASSEQAALADGSACTGVTVSANENATVRFDVLRPIHGVVVVVGIVERDTALRVIDVELERGFVTHSRMPSPLFAGHAFAGVFVAEREIAVRGLRLRAPDATTEWLEIAPFSCEGAVRSPLDDRQQYRTVPGKGACRRDDDCFPARCCHASSCVSRSLAPACAGIGCPQNCPPDSVQCRGACACIQGRCGAVFRQPGPDEDGMQLLPSP